VQVNSCLTVALNGSAALRFAIAAANDECWWQVRRNDCTNAMHTIWIRRGFGGLRRRARATTHQSVPVSVPGETTKKAVN